MRQRNLREQVSRTARWMVASGLVTGTSGNVSVRTPEGDVLITPSGLDYEVLEPEDVVLVDPEGRPLEGSLKPSSETPLHRRYLLFEAASRGRGSHPCALRDHAGLLGLGDTAGPLHDHRSLRRRVVPLTPYAGYGSEELAGHVSKALGESRQARLLQNHGTIAVGKSAEEALHRTVILEEMAEIYYRIRIAGEPILLTPEQVAEVAAKIVDYGQSKPSGAS